MITLRSIKIVEILCTALFISLAGMYISVSNSPEKATTLQLHFVIATVLVLLVSLASISVMLRYAYVFYVIVNVLLVMVLLQGHMVSGATRWIMIGSIRFQPSELVKFVLPLIVLKYYCSRNLNSFSKIINTPLIIIAVPVFLVLSQPDLGTAIVITGASVIIMYLLGLSRSIVVRAMLLLLVILPLVWFVMLPYQKMRVLAFLWPSKHAPFSFQVEQALFAIHSGGVLGQEMPTNLVPAGTTDFIFSLFACKFGALGVVVLLFLFSRLINAILYLAKYTVNPFLSALAGSYAFLLASSLLINIFMVTGLAPVVGLPLPLMSYGGTAFLVHVTIIASLVAAFRKKGGQELDGPISPFRRLQHARLNLLNGFFKAGQGLIILRLLVIYFGHY